MSDTPRTDDLVLHLAAHEAVTVTQALYCYTMMRNLADALELEIAILEEGIQTMNSKNSRFGAKT